MLELTRKNEIVSEKSWKVPWTQERGKEQAYAMENRFTVPQRVHFYHCDREQNLTLRAYLEWSGEMGNLHLESRGITWREMQQQRQVFLLSRLAFRRLAPVTYGLHCRFHTWEYGIKGPQFIRNFSLEGEDGALLAQSTSAWILVDPVERKILRPSQCVYTMQPNPTPVQPALERLHLPELPELARHVVRPSQIDCNGHLGNQFYADLICDYAPEGFQGRAVQALQISFDHEAYLGQTITLCGQSTGPRSFALEGRLPDGRRCFGALVEV